MWGHFKEGVLKACDEVYGKTMGRRNKRHTWWWNEEVKDAVSGKKEVHKAMCQNRTEENKRRHESLKNKAKKAVSKAIREKAEFKNCPYGMPRLVKGLKTDSKEVKRRRCMR